MRSIDKEYCMSSFLVFRYVIDDEKDFYEHTYHQIYKLIPDNERILVEDEYEIDQALRNQFQTLRNKKLGILLSGGMDSACLASYMEGCDAYTFRFLGGCFQKDELARAEYYAKRYNLTLHYVDISWESVQNNLNSLMKKKGAPVHSIEPQILTAIKQAKNDGIDLMIIGDAADYVFGGMDGLHAKDWLFDEFVRRYSYLDPEDILVSPVNMNSAFEKYRIENDRIDFIALMHEYTDIESYASYANAFSTGEMPFLDPYERLKMKKELDLNRIRSGESKYLIRALFKLKYPERSIPQKLPMPRPVDEYFKTWAGPIRHEFRTDIRMDQLSGNQKWLLYSLEQFLNLNEK